MLQHYEFFRDALDLVRSHHERPDGKGYPDKLRGNRIPRGASIIAVADSFDAMTSNRPYRNSLGYDRAVEEIREYEGVQHDREIGDLPLAHHPRSGRGGPGGGAPAPLRDLRADHQGDRPLTSRGLEPAHVNGRRGDTQLLASTHGVRSDRTPEAKHSPKRLELPESTTSRYNHPS